MTLLNNEAAPIGERPCEDPSSVKNHEEEGINTPTMDYDEWAEDPFILAKEIDIFPSFTGAGEENIDTNSSTSVTLYPTPLSGQVAGKDVRANTGDASKADKITRSQCIERKRIKRPRQKEKISRSEVRLKRTIYAKKKANKVPISRRKKKPKSMPKRPLSAYNLYFQAERTKIIANQQAMNGPRIGFEGLGKVIGKQWRGLTCADKKEYEKLAEEDSERYRKEMNKYHEMKAKRFAEEDRRAEEQSHILSSIASSTIPLKSCFDANFSQHQRSLQTVPLGETLGNSILLPKQTKSVISTISSLKHETTSISYRPIEIEQTTTLPRHALQHSDVLKTLNSRSSVGAVQRALYFPQSAGVHRSKASSCDSVVLSPEVTVTSAASCSNSCPMPPGMEVVLSDRSGIDRKYRVQYTCYSMTRENANKYMKSLGAVDSTAQMAPLIDPNREHGVWEE